MGQGQDSLLRPHPSATYCRVMSLSTFDFTLTTSILTVELRFQKRLYVKGLGCRIDDGMLDTEFLM